MFLRWARSSVFLPGFLRRSSKLILHFPGQLNWLRWHRLERGLPGARRDNFALQQQRLLPDPAQRGQLAISAAVGAAIYLTPARRNGKCFFQVFMVIGVPVLLQAVIRETPDMLWLFPTLPLSLRQFGDVFNCASGFRNRLFCLFDLQLPMQYSRRDQIFKVTQSRIHTLFCGGDSLFRSGNRSRRGKVSSKRVLPVYIGFVAWYYPIQPVRHRLSPNLPPLRLPWLPGRSFQN